MAVQFPVQFKVVLALRMLSMFRLSQGADAILYTLYGTFQAKPSFHGRRSLEATERTAQHNFSLDTINILIFTNQQPHLQHQVQLQQQQQHSL